MSLFRNKINNSEKNLDEFWDDCLNSNDIFKNEELCINCK